VRLWRRNYDGRRRIEAPSIRAHSELGICGLNRMLLEHAHQKPMGRRSRIAIVRNLSGHESVARNVCVNELVWRSVWLEPMDIVQICEANVGGPPVGPIPLNSNEHLAVCCHDSLIGVRRSHLILRKNAIRQRGEHRTRTTSRSRDQPLADRIEHDLGSVMQIQLLHQIGAMCLYGREAQIQKRCDFLVRAAFRQKVQHLPFSFG
jgi:hypothetical protein